MPKLIIDKEALMNHPRVIEEYNKRNSIEQFIASKPKELRLGQYFCNTYLSGASPEKQTFQVPVWLYNTNDDGKVVEYIKLIMESYQWVSLAAVEEKS